jgi:hypothetical protein
MPTSAQSAVSASARLSVDGSECDREPARDNVTPCNVQNNRRTTARALRLHCYAGAIDGNQLTLDHCVCITASIADVDSPAIETFVIALGAQWPFRARR